MGKAQLSDLEVAGHRYCGPLLLINTTINLVGEHDPTRPKRLGDAFVLSPVYYGSKLTGYVRTKAAGKNLTLGRTMAISGAAIDPNMSYIHSLPLTALLTVLNARLGYWIANPSNPGPSGWHAIEPLSAELLFRGFFRFKVRGLGFLSVLS